MNIQHFEKGFTYSDRQLLVLARKIGKLATYCKRLKDASSFIRVDAQFRNTEKKKDAMKVMITLELPKKTLRAESRREDVIDAVERCIEKLQPQVLKYKDLRIGSKKKRLKKAALLAL